MNIQLNEAVEEERFEDAARLRDEILELKKERQRSWNSIFPVEEYGIFII